LEELIKTNTGDFIFAGIELSSYDFYENGVLYLPTIQTVDEWFAEAEKKNDKC
jgi:hypothetical protein